MPRLLLPPEPVRRSVVSLSSQKLNNLVLNIEKGLVEPWSLAFGIEAAIECDYSTPGSDRLDAAMEAVFVNRYDAISGYVEAGEKDDTLARLANAARRELEERYAKEDPRIT